MQNLHPPHTINEKAIAPQNPLLNSFRLILTTITIAILSTLTYS